MSVYEATPVSQDVIIFEGSSFIVLGMRDLGFLCKLADHPDIKDKKGEELVTELVKLAKQGQIGRVSRYKNGVLHDGPDDRPALKLFNMDGVLVQSCHYREGVPVNPPSGPAMTIFDDKGRKVATKTAKDGSLLPFGPLSAPAFNRLRRKHFEETPYKLRREMAPLPKNARDIINDAFEGRIFVPAEKEFPPKNTPPPQSPVDA